MLQMTSSEPPVDLRPADLVSRLLAATPPYLYTMPLSNSFFFSEMLRSFVQARASAVPSRRGRKRAWRETRPLPPQNDKPLELTTNPKPPPTPPGKSETPPKETSQNMLIQPCNVLPLPSAEAPALLPTAPLWFPPLNMYPPPPPQCFDPHYFVDLRVSGHIWDRKHEKDHVPIEPLNLQTEEKKDVLNLSFRKHNSAFSVPQPREHQEKITNKSPSGTNYFLQNLDKIYKDVKPKQEESKEELEEGLTPEEKKVRDLRALIGLELVVDYVKQEDTPGDRGNHTEDSSDSNDEPLVMD